MPGSCLEFPYYVLALVRDERALYWKRGEVSPHPRELHPVAEAVHPSQIPLQVTVRLVGESWREEISSLLIPAFAQGHNALQCPGPRSSS